MKIVIIYDSWTGKNRYVGPIDPNSTKDKIEWFFKQWYEAVSGEEYDPLRFDFTMETVHRTIMHIDHDYIL